MNARIALSPRSWPIPPGWVWFLGLFLMWVWGLGQAPLFDVDEGAFAEASREMLRSGDWGHTTLNGTDRFDKPILIYWFQAASMSLAGVNEWAVRLPSALAAFVWCVAVGHFAAQRLGAGARWVAAGMLASSLGVILIGRASTADALLNTLITLAALDVWRHLESGERAPQRRAFFWMGLGLLTKGPVAVLVPGAATLVYLLCSGQWRPVRRLLDDLPSWAIVLGTAAPWYAYALHRHGMAFVEGFLLKHNVGRYLQPMEGHGGSVAYFLVALPVILLPWSPALVAAVLGARQAWNTPWLRFMWGWAGFVLVFFSLSGTKLPHYGMYGLTPLVLLSVAAMQTAQAGGSVRPLRWLPWALGLTQLLLLAVLASSAWLAPMLAQKTRDPLMQALLREPGPGLSIGWIAALLGALALLWSRRAWAWTHRATATSVLLALWVLHAFIPWWADRLQGPVKAMAAVAQQAAVAQGKAVVVTQWSIHQPSLAFYLQQPAPRREPQAGEMALVRMDRTDVNQPGWVLLGQRAGFGMVWIDRP